MTEGDGGISGSWIMVALGAVPGILSGGWVALRWWAERGDKRDVQSLSHQERLAQEMDSQRAAMSKDAADLFDRARAELLRVDTRRLALERDCQQGWDLARAWLERTHEVAHIARDAQAIANAALIQAGLPVREWPKIALPTLEAII